MTSVLSASDNGYAPCRRKCALNIVEIKNTKNWPTDSLLKKNIIVPVPIVYSLKLYEIAFTETINIPTDISINF